jgi:hypothetical protein
MDNAEQFVELRLLHHPQLGATLLHSGNAEAHEGTGNVREFCSPHPVKRSRVLQELLSAAAADIGPSTVRLPISKDAFTAWHDFGPGQDTSPDTLCRVLQV